MADKKKCGCGCKPSKIINNDEAINSYPGVSINEADNEKVSASLEKERTKVLGNNPNGQL